MKTYNVLKIIGQKASITVNANIPENGLFYHGQSSVGYINWVDDDGEVSDLTVEPYGKCKQWFRTLKAFRAFMATIRGRT